MHARLNVNMTNFLGMQLLVLSSSGFAKVADFNCLYH